MEPSVVHLPWCEAAETNYALFTSASESFNTLALTGIWGSSAILPIDRHA